MRRAEHKRFPIQRVPAKTARMPLLPILVLTLTLSATGCRNDMHDGARLKPLEESFAVQGRSIPRQPVPGTKARGAGGTTEADIYLATGRLNGQPGNTLPFPLTRDLLERGQERFNIYCSPCHDRVGTGQGMIVQRGFSRPPSYHIDRLRQAPLGHFVDVMTNGFGAMHSYAYRVPPRDRWAIAAYIRVLQLSQGAAVSDVPHDAVEKLDETSE